MLNTAHVGNAHIYDPICTADGDRNIYLEHLCGSGSRFESVAQSVWELSPNCGDGRAGQAAAVLG